MTQEPTTASVPLPTVSVLLLFVGTFTQHPADKDKIARFILVTEEQANDKQLPSESDETQERNFAKDIFGKNKHVVLVAGTVYRVNAGDEQARSIYAISMRYGFQWPDDALRARLRAEDDARQAERDALRLLKGDDALRKALAPVTAAYARAIGTHKAHILARAVAIITRG